MAIDLTDIDIYLVPFQEILRNVQMFSFDNLLLSFKNQLAICQSANNLFNADFVVDINTNFNPSKLVILPFTSPSLSWDTIPSLITRAYNKFVFIVKNNKANYFAMALVEEKQLTTNFALETLELIYHGEFASCQFRLYILQAPLLLAEKANAIGQRYGRLNL